MKDQLIKKDNVITVASVLYRKMFHNYRTIGSDVSGSATSTTTYYYYYYYYADGARIWEGVIVQQKKEIADSNIAFVLWGLKLLEAKIKSVSSIIRSQCNL